MVEKAEEGGGILFLLEDGRKFKSASAAASAVMGGKAVNGWRFWSVQGTEAAGQGKQGRSLKRRPAKSKRLVYRVPNQKGIAEGQSRWFCRACMKGFVIEDRGWAARGLSGRPPWRRPGADGGSGPSGGNERVGVRMRAGDEAPSGACLVDGMRSAPGRDEEKAGVEDGDDCE